MSCRMSCRMSCCVSCRVDRRMDRRIEWWKGCRNESRWRWTHQWRPIASVMKSLAVVLGASLWFFAETQAARAAGLADPGIHAGMRAGMQLGLQLGLHVGKHVRVDVKPCSSPHADGEVGMDSQFTRRRVKSQLEAFAVEALAVEAALSMCASEWGGADRVSPVLSACDDHALDATPAERRSALLAGLVETMEPRPRAVWAALRAKMINDERIAPGEGAWQELPQQLPQELPQKILAYLSDEDLDRACLLIVRESLLHALDESVQLPPDTVRSILDALPRPLQRRGSSKDELRVLNRLELAGRLGSASLSDAQTLCADLEAATRVQLEWIARLDKCYTTLMHRAFGAEGTALVRVSRSLRLTAAGWDPQEIASMHNAALETSARIVSPSSSTSTKRAPVDRVSADIRLARSQGASCYALSELLAEAQPISVRTIQSALLDGDRHLCVGRREVVLPIELLNRWRLDCGLIQTPRGWESPSARPKNRVPRIRDAPFGVKPL